MVRCQCLTHIITGFDAGKTILQFVAGNFVAQAVADVAHVTKGAA